MSETDKTIMGQMGDPESFDVAATFVPKQEAPPLQDTLADEAIQARARQENQNAQSPQDTDLPDGYDATIVPGSQPDLAVEQTLVPGSSGVASQSPQAGMDTDDANSNTIVPEFQLSDEDSADIPLQKVTKSRPPGPASKRTVAGTSGSGSSNDSEGELQSEAATVQRPTDAPVNRPGRGNQSRFASNLSRQIWRSHEKQDFSQLITVRKGPVSGTAPFALQPEADFEVTQKLAEGGMGVVYIARQKSLNRELAIKTLKHQGNSDGTMPAQESGARHRTRADQQRRDMFMSEALVTANLVHPNIIPIHDLAETDNGTLYYAMKRVHGVPWNQSLRSMTLQENLDVLEKVCDAIAYAHHHGVVNRDLKPENIMLGEYGEVLVLDWGLAVPAPHAADPNFRSPVASFGAGTPAYMSPELWTGPPDKIGEWSDIYLLGAILFEIITGAAPHQFPDSNARRSSGDFWKSLDEVLRFNQIRQVPYTGELLDIALKAMHTDPDQRHGSVLEFQFAIRSFQRHEESRRLTRRADELMNNQGDANTDYSLYQAAAALHEEALRVWNNNSDSRKQLRDVRLSYARVARERGDYDLAIQVAALEEGPEFSDLTKRLQNAKVMRSSAKWLALIAMTAVVLLGAKSIYDNGIIIDLNSEVMARQLEAQEAVNKANRAEADADAATRTANEATQTAAQAVNDARQAEEDANRAKMEALLARTEAQNSREQAATALAEASRAASEAEMSKQAAATAMTQAEAAEQRRVEAINQQAAAETAARVAEVEIQFQSIRGLALDENYTDAVRAIDRLLEGQLLQSLPDAMRLERTTELQIQKQQLQKRTLQTDAPIQSQVISPDFLWLAQGDTTGKLLVRPNPAIQGEWADEQKIELQLNGPITDIVFPQPDALLVACEQQVFRIELASGKSSLFIEHQSHINTIDVNAARLLSGDRNGTIVVTDLASGERLADLQLTAEIRDLKFVPASEMFVSAATRGNESADVIAWQLVGTKDDTVNIERLGQLRFPRDQVVPPLQLGLSPDGMVMVLSNSRNGDLLTLVRTPESLDQPADSGTESNPKSIRRGFPFGPSASNIGVTLNPRQSHQRPVNDLQWSHDGQLLASASDDRSIIIWKRSGNELQFVKRLTGHGGRVSQSSFFDTEGRFVGSSSSDLSSRLWDLTTYDEDRKAILNSLKLTQTPQPRTTIVASSKTEDIRPVAMLVDRRNSAEQLTSPNHSEYVLCGSTAEAEDEQLERGAQEDPQESCGIDCITLNKSPIFHRGSIEDLDFSNDGQVLLTGASDGTVAMWQVSDGTMLQRGTMQELFSEGHRFNISRSRMMKTDSTDEPDFLITAGFDGTLRLWELSSHKNQGLQRAAVQNVGVVHAFDVARDGSFLITSGFETEPMGYHCRIFSTERLLKATGHDLNPDSVLDGLHTSDVTAISISPDGRVVATAARDGKIGIWSYQSGALLAVCRGHRNNTIISQLAWSAEGDLYSAGFDGQLMRWNLAESEVLASAPKPEPPSEPIIVSDPIRLKTRGLPIEYLCLSPINETLLIVSIEDIEDKSGTSLYQSYVDRIQPSKPDAFTSVPLAKMSDRSSQTVYSVDWREDGDEIMISTGQHLHFINPATWKTVRVVAASGFAEAAAMYAQARVQKSDETNSEGWIILSDGPSASLWDLKHNQRLATFDGPSMIRSVAISKDADHAIAMSTGVHTRCFSADNHDEGFGTILQRLPTDPGVLTTKAKFSTFQPALCAIGTNKGAVEFLLYDLESKQETGRQLIASLSAPIADLAFEQASNRLIAVSADGELLIASPAEMGQMPLHQIVAKETVLKLVNQQQRFVFRCCCVSSDGKHLFLGGYDRSTETSLGWILEYAVGPHLQPELKFQSEVRGHSAGGILSAEFLPGTPWIGTGGNDGALIVWNWKHPIVSEVPSAYEAFRLSERNNSSAHNAPITALRATSTGIIGSASTDRTAKLWRFVVPADMSRFTPRKSSSRPISIQ